MENSKQENRRNSVNSVPSCFVGAKSVTKFIDNLDGEFTCLVTSRFLKAMKNHNWDLWIDTIVCNGVPVSKSQVKKHLHL